MIITNDTLQIDLIALLLAEASITGLLGDASDVREHNYMAKNFKYPNVRIGIILNEPYLERDQCTHSRAMFAVRCYTEDSSSGSCQELAAAVVDFLHKKFITGTGWKGKSYLVSMGGPETIRDELWRVENMFTMNLYPTSAP